jgi:hypothetical protein
MITERARTESADELQQPSQGFDDIAASISALEKAMLEPPVRDREAIHELGCRIVAQALKSK